MLNQRLISNIFKFLGILVALWLVFELVASLAIKIAWFEEVGYLSVFLKRLSWKLGLMGVTAGSSWWFLGGNLRQADRHQWHTPPSDVLNPPKRRRDRKNASRQLLPESRGFGLLMLLGLVLGFGGLIAMMVLYYGQMAVKVWTPDFSLAITTPSLSFLPELLAQIGRQLWKAGIIGVIIALILINSRFWLRAIAILLSLIFGLVVSGNWTQILKYFYLIPFEREDPLFYKDISFYVFKLPFWQLINFWLGGLFLYGLLAVSMTYLLSAKSLSQGKFPGFSRPQLRHLYLLGGLMMGVIALRQWLARYQLLSSPSGVVYGAGYTDVHVELPLNTILAILAAIISVWLLLKVAMGWGKEPLAKSRRLSMLPRLPFSPLPFAVYLFILLGGLLGAPTIQRIVVEPNELARETPYIDDSIAYTRAAFKLDAIQSATFDASGQLSAADLQQHRLTFDNIRLWDTRPLLQTNRQLQQIRLYYKFLDANIDRYSILSQNERSPEEAGGRGNAYNPLPLVEEAVKRQVLIAARELDYSAVPEQAKTWVNEHLIYTHGYGFTMSPVNQVDQGGLPYYFVKNIGTAEAEGELQTSSSLIRNSIPLSNPRIYFGELTDTYIMTDTKVKELDYPRGEDNAYNTYEGRGGIPLGSWGRRLLFAQYLKDWQMLFTQNFTPDTQVLIRRNINHRLREIAPFLQYDRDPYLVAAEIEPPIPGKQVSSLYWIMDAYTSSDRYPYSDPGNWPFNYIRNSVKITIDAYNGDVNFYVIDQDDPIIQTWTQIFPELFKPFEAMPPALKAHIRYPRDMFGAQSERLLTYHMTNPQVFYNREDLWRIPQEIYGEKEQPVEPYYLLMSVDNPSQEFILVHVYTPVSRNNLIAGLFARSDAENYGKMLLYTLPKQRLIYGPEQIEALINQDPAISEQLSLWNQQGSRVIQGNLLVIPFFKEQSLLYVEPLYLEAEHNSLPTLARVTVVYDNQIVMAKTLNEALQTIFARQQ